MINLTQDSHGRVYQIWQQQQQSTCGIACCWMARSIALQMSLAEEEWDLAIRTYANAVANALAPQGGPMTYAATDSSGNALYPNDQSSFASAVTTYGFEISQLATALRNDGLTVVHDGFSGGSRRVVDRRISASKPAIALVRWNGGGGHFVVVGRATRSRVSFLDPWNGQVNELDNDGFYWAQYNDMNGPITQILYVSA